MSTVFSDNWNWKKLIVNLHKVSSEEYLITAQNSGLLFP